MTHDERMAMTETIEQRTRQLLSYASGGIDGACESLHALITEMRRLDAENERLRAGLMEIVNQCTDYRPLRMANDLLGELSQGLRNEPEES